MNNMRVKGANPLCGQKSENKLQLALRIHGYSFS